MDIQAMQSMDWLFKKERIYLLAQFWQQRATLAEKEVSALKEQLAVANQNSLSDSKMAAGPGEDVNRSSIQVELSAKDKEVRTLPVSNLHSVIISQLVEDVQRLQSSIGKLQESSSNQIARLEEELELKRQHICRLEARLEAQRDYEDLKRQLSILRSIELPRSSEASKSLEAVLAERNKFVLQVEGNVSSTSVKPPSCPTPLSEVTNSGEVHNTSDTGVPPLIFPAPAPPPPPPLQNVETFGSFLGEEIVANWRRSLERTILSQGAAVTPTPMTGQQPPPTPTPTPPQHVQDNSEDPTGKPEQKAETPEREGDVETLIPASASPGATEFQINGGGSTPCKSPAAESDVCSNNNNNISNNNNTLPSGLVNGMCGLNVGLNNNVLSSSTPISFNDVLKSPFRFDDRSPFRFSDDPGAIVGRFGESLIPKGDPMEARLQEMLRYNMDKYSTQNLDTLHIARRVRELLSIHNVGQRLFAKYVLGLSQGTVSELLSKPKPWDKLTEKGRDSYRKMHAWACDENAVLLLKSLIPKKGKDTGIPSVFSRGDADITEERIAHILNEASQLMKPQSHEDSHSNDDSKSPNHGQCPSPLGRDSSQNRRLKKYENDDIPQEQVVRIYQEELAKLMGRRIEDTMRGDQPFPGLIFPHFFGTGGSGEEIRMALDAYHRELAKLNAQCPGVPNPGLFALQQQVLNQHQQAASLTNPQNGMAQDLSLPKTEKKNDQGKLPNGEIILEQGLKKEGTPAGQMDSVAEAIRHAGSAFSLVRPKTEPGMGHISAGSSASSPLGNSILPPEDFSPSAAVSPLQRMASITNALISQPSTPHHHSPSQRPLKAVLPPITQQQFDQFNNLNTEEIVRKVKEQLSQFSISQRLFGESVLGLSQGSVSDLLARPKPWHMLTQKGREPFIRMKMFLEDDNAVHKLVASQYKIAPEKLMRTGGYGVSTTSSSISKPLPPASGKLPSMPPSMDMKPGETGVMGPLNYLHPPQQVPPPPPPPIHLSATHHLPPNQQAALDQIKKSHQSLSLQQCNSLPQQQQTPPIQLQTQQQQQTQPQQQQPLLTQQQTQQTQPHPLQQNHQSQQHQQQQQHQHMRSLSQHVAPSVYEMAALTQDLDTQVITTKIKEVLLANNIGQKIFGEAVLGLSQGSVSELLSKPKPWHMLSIKGREPFIRMQLWLTDAHNIERLQLIKSERRELNKRRRGSGQQDNSSDTSSNDTSEFYHSSASSPPSAKKQRVLFSEEQKEALRLAFALDPYPSLATIEFLANELTLASRTITNWFHNHRMRLKQQSPHSSDSSQPNRENQGSGFDPHHFRLLLSQRLGIGNIPGLSAFPPPYFPPNPELAALISRGILPLQEQVSGLDLSVKHEAGTDYEDNDSRLDSEESDSGVPEMTPVPEPRINRRKPAAPQWVNPDWQEEPEVINGVCVMQTEDYTEREREGETVRVEPTPVMEEEEEEEHSVRSSPTSTSVVRTSPNPMDVKLEVKEELHPEEERKTNDEEERQIIKEEKWDSEF